MLQSYIKIAMRSLYKNRLFSIINVAGLGLGIAAFIFIFEYVAFEKSVNMFHKTCRSSTACWKAGLPEMFLYKWPRP
ncbi:hypothetical protein [Dyadobacter frigoris]|uniref:hypothetical protein n=1 Tax=Dyadobacter frigoris TaxID=2576211 RepID=UPI001E569FCB|nr:hypothetical protein [Dyadobacter frigoris]